MIKNNFKIALFASLMVAMILPFSAMNFADAAPNENANQIAKERSDRSLRVDPTPLAYDEIDDKTSKKKHEIKEERKNKPEPPAPTLGTGHEAFGTLLDKSVSSITGVYSKNEVHDSGISLVDGTFLYAPTTLSPNYSGWEVVTLYEGTSTSTDKYVVLYNHNTNAYNWNNEFTINSSFIADYTSTIGSNDYYYTEIIKSGSTWYAYIYNFDTPGWEVWDTVSGNGSIADGWVAWEEYYFDNSNCPTTLPEIAAGLVKVYHNSSWKLASSTYSNEYDSGSICGITSASFNSNYYDWTVDD